MISVVINGLKIVTKSPSFQQCVERESGGLKPRTGCPIKNFRNDRQIEMIFHSIKRMLLIALFIYYVIILMSELPLDKEINW